MELDGKIEPDDLLFEVEHFDDLIGVAGGVVVVFCGIGFVGLRVGECLIPDVEIVDLVEVGFSFGHGVYFIRWGRFFCWFLER